MDGNLIVGLLPFQGLEKGKWVEIPFQNDGVHFRLYGNSFEGVC